MVFTRIQAQILIKQLNNLSINQKIQVADPVVNYVLIPFKMNTNNGEPHGLKLYLKATKEIYK